MAEASRSRRRRSGAAPRRGARRRVRRAVRSRRESARRASPRLGGRSRARHRGRRRRRRLRDTARVAHEARLREAGYRGPIGRAPSSVAAGRRPHRTRPACWRERSSRATSRRCTCGRRTRRSSSGERRRDRHRADDASRTCPASSPSSARRSPSPWTEANFRHEIEDNPLAWNSSSRGSAAVVALRLRVRRGRRADDQRPRRRCRPRRRGRRERAAPPSPRRRARPRLPPRDARSRARRTRPRARSTRSFGFDGRRAPPGLLRRHGRGRHPPGLRPVRPPDDGPLPPGSRAPIVAAFDAWTPTPAEHAPRDGNRVPAPRSHRRRNRMNQNKDDASI